MVEDFKGTYSTGCQTHLFLNGTKYIGQALGISYQVTYGRTPIYGYRSTFFDRTAKGQSITQGVLLINLLDFRYLDIALNLPDDPQLGPRNSLKSTILKALPDMQNFDVNIAESLYAQTINGLALTAGDEASSLLGQNAHINSLIQRNRGAAVFHENPFDLVIVTGNPNDVGLSWEDRKDISIRRIKGVEIVGESFEVMANDNVLIMGFPFLARQPDYNYKSIEVALRSMEESRQAATPELDELQEEVDVEATPVDEQIVIPEPEEIIEEEEMLIGELTFLN